MKKNKIITLVVLIIVLMGAFFISENYRKKNKISSEEIIKKYNTLYNGGNKSIVYIGRTGCGYCEMYSPIIEEAAKENNFEYYYIDLSKLTIEDRTALYNTGDVFKDEKFGTPTTLVVGNGSVNESHIGYMEKEELIKFLKEAKVIK